MTNSNVCYIEFYLIQLTLYKSKKFIACQFKSVEIKKIILSGYCKAI